MKTLQKKISSEDIFEVNSSEQTYRLGFRFKRLAVSGKKGQRKWRYFKNLQKAKI